MPSSNNFGSPVSHSSSCRMQHFFFFIFNNVILWLNFLFFFSSWALVDFSIACVTVCCGVYTDVIHWMFSIWIWEDFFLFIAIMPGGKKRMTSSRKLRLGDAFDICQLNLCVFLFCSRAYRPWCSVWTNGYCRFRYLRLTTNLHILRLRFDLLTSTL